LNPDDSLKVKPIVFSDWWDQYLLAKNPVQVQGSTIQAYEPSAIVSYHDSLGNKHNYVCKITNIVLNQDGNGNPIPWFTFDTSKVVFYDKTSYIPTVGTPFVRVPIVNDPEVTKIDTHFLPGTFSDINIDFDPLYDPIFDPIFDPAPPMVFYADDMNIVKNNGKWIASVSMMHRYVSYRSWSHTDNSKNQTLSVYVDKITGFTKRFKSVLFNRTDTPQDSFKPAVKLEFRTRDGKTSTSTVQINDCYVHKDKLLFELNNENIKLYDDNEGLVSSHKTISKQLNEGSFTHVKMGWFHLHASCYTYGGGWVSSLNQCIPAPPIVIPL
jgi:hypothetical protein